jgi:hypothetical protein
MVATSSRHSSANRATGSDPTTSATRNTPPTSGAAMSSLNTESAIA